MAFRMMQCAVAVGMVLSRTIVRDGQRVHEIKVVTKDGVVKTVRVPENS